MRGRPYAGHYPFNRSHPRKGEIFAILSELGGKARWSHLLKRARERRMGPTTLKRLLDEMEEEGVIKVEARRGKRGPEVWYILTPTREEAIKKLMKKPVGRRVLKLIEVLNSNRGDPEAIRKILRENLPHLLASYLAEHFIILMRTLEDPETEIRPYFYLYENWLSWEASALIFLFLKFKEEIEELKAELYSLMIQEFQKYPCACRLIDFIPRVRVVDSSKTLQP